MTAAVMFQSFHKVKGENPHGQTLAETFSCDIFWAGREHQCLAKLSDRSSDLQPINP